MAAWYRRHQHKPHVMQRMGERFNLHPWTCSRIIKTVARRGQVQPGHRRPRGFGKMVLDMLERGASTKHVAEVTGASQKYIVVIRAKARRRKLEGSENREQRTTSATP